MTLTKVTNNMLDAAFTFGPSNFVGTLPATKGGTGYASYTIGDITYANTTTTLAKLGLGANQTLLKSNGSTPLWGKVDVANEVSGLLAIANGGTGANTGSGAIAALGGLGIVTESLAATGYVELTNGLIVQWGSVSAAANAFTTITYPKALTTWAVPVASSARTTSNAQDNFAGVVDTTTTTFRVYSANDVALACFWIAVGK